MAKTSSPASLPLPFYAKASLILVGLFVFIHMLALGKSIIVPLLFATVMSILLSTLVDFLEKKKMDRVAAISVSLIITIAVGFLVGFFIVTRVNIFIESLPELIVKFDELQVKFVSWLSDYFNIRQSKANTWINEARTDITLLSGARFSDTIAAIGGAAIVMILIPVYIFLILFYQPLLIDFVHRIMGDDHTRDVTHVLGESKAILKNYFAGLLIELVIIAVLNSIGLLLLGVQYAILIGILGALLNMVPYIGGMITLVLSMLMAMLTSDLENAALWAAVVFFIIQTFDNYFLLPKIVGSKVKINALVAIVVVIAGGALWGISGMFLALPITAILKVIFDRIEELKPWGFLLGDTMPPMVRIKLRKKRAAA